MLSSVAAVSLHWKWISNGNHVSGSDREERALRWPQRRRRHLSDYSVQMLAATRSKRNLSVNLCVAVQLTTVERGTWGGARQFGINCRTSRNILDYARLRISTNKAGEAFEFGNLHKHHQRDRGNKQ